MTSFRVTRQQTNRCDPARPPQSGRHAASGGRLPLSKPDAPGVSRRRSSSWLLRLQRSRVLVVPRRRRRAFTVLRNRHRPHIGRLRAGRRPSRPLTPSGPARVPQANPPQPPPTPSPDRRPSRAGLHAPGYVRPTRPDQAAGVRPTRCSGSYGVRSRSSAHATLSSRSETVRRAWPWRLPRPRSSPYRSRLAASCWIATRAQ